MQYARDEKTANLRGVYVFEFLSEFGLPYHRRKDRNAAVLTSLGTVKTTSGVQKTMWKGVMATEKRKPTLLIDFHGLKDYSARLVMTTQKTHWENLRAARVFFPGKQEGEEFFAGEITARELERADVRKKLIQSIRPHLENARFVGVPSILGIQHSHKVLVQLEKGLGLPVFEIPTIPPSVPGQRLKETFEEGLRTKGVRIFFKIWCPILNWMRAKTLIFTSESKEKARELRPGGAHFGYWSLHGWRP